MMYVNMPVVKNDKEKEHKINPDDFELLFDESSADDFDKLSDLFLFIIFALSWFSFELVSDIWGMIKAKFSFSKN